MKLREKLKRFWTLDVHNHEGFTLVELIIVIAILAILSTGAIAGYSAYIKQANMTADQALVSEIANVLTLYYYSHGITGSDYVILDAEGASTLTSADDNVLGFAEAALAEAYGENWSEVLRLKYSDWTDDGLLQYVLDNADSAGLIANSTYLTTASPDSLMGAVNNLTDAANDVIKNYAANGGDVTGKLTTLLGDDFVTKLGNTGVALGDDEYETVVSNMLVGHFANVLHGADSGEVMEDTGMVGMMMSYATLYAYCQTIGDTTTMAGLDAYLAESDEMDDLTPDGINGFIEANCSDAFKEGYLKYNLGENLNGEGGKLMSDVNAALEIMGAVGHIAGTYTDKDTLSNPNLYSSESVGEQLNNYISAIKAVANMDSATLATLNSLGSNSVTIFVAEDGSISVVPGAAFLANK